jgi:hypothetical protein
MSLDVIRSFLSRALVIEDERHGTCSRVSLAHGKSSGASIPLQAWTIDQAHRSQAHAQSMAADVYRAAQDHAEAFDGVQRYELLAYYGDEQAPQRRTAFRVTNAERSSMSAAEPTEEATTRGLLAQMMRHNEATARLSLQTTEVNFRTLHAQNTELRAENESLRTRLHESMTAVEKALSEQHSRDLETKRFALKAHQTAQLVEKVNLLMPVLVNRFAGSRVMPLGAGADRMRALVSSIKTEQLQAMASSLSPEQAIAFFDLIKDYLPEDQPKAEQQH